MAKKPASDKPKTGRPSKFNEVDLDKVRALATKGWTDDEMAAIDEQQAQAAQMQQVLAAAPVAASAAKDLAQAGAIAGTAEGQQMPGVVPG